jgi:thiamine-phosphate pyrophosphorylase
MPCSVVRKIVPGDFVIGVSARTVEEAVEAEKNGADYLGVGALFPTGSKDKARVIGPEGLKKITDVTSLPVVAIGGINHSNAPEAFQSGADGVSVISAVFGAKNIKKSSAELYEICRRHCIGGF